MKVCQLCTRSGGGGGGENTHHETLVFLFVRIINGLINKKTYLQAGTCEEAWCLTSSLTRQIIRLRLGRDPDPLR